MRSILSILLLIAGIRAEAQDFPSLVFSHITEKNGLSNNDARWITQDARGFIWIGTHDGLNRLDGYRIRNFFHQPGDSNSLVNNAIVQVVPGADQALWIGTVQGLSCYNTVRNRFVNFSQQPTRNGSLSADYARALLFDSVSGLLWASVPGAIYTFDKGSNTTKYPVAALALQGRVSPDIVHFNGMYEDSKHRCWIYFGNAIYLLDRERRKVTAAFHVGSGEDVRSLIEDSHHHYWVATFGGGLFQFDPERSLFSPMALDGGARFLHSLCEWKDKDGHAWIVAGGTSRLILVNPETLEFRIYTSDASQEYGLLPGDISCLYVDRENILWIGSASGVSYIAPSRQRILAWDILDRDKKNAAERQDFIYGFGEDSTQFLASCWSSDRLLRFDKQGQRLARSGDMRRVYGIVNTGKGFLMTVDSGLLEDEAGRGNFETIHSGGSGLRTILRYDDTTFWIRTRNNGDGGIYIYNSRLKKMTAHYYGEVGCASCLPPRLQDLLITRDKAVFTCPQDHGLWQFDKQNGRFVSFFESEKEIALLPSKNFVCLAEGPDRNLWVGTGNGLFELDRSSRRMIRDFSNNRQLAGVSIDALCFDDSWNLWINTARGLFCVAAGTDKVFHFSREDGLPDNSLPAFIFKGMDGYMYTGCPGYILKFRPKELLHEGREASSRISEVMVMNHTAPMDEDGETHRLVLNPNEDFFSVDFSVLNYDNLSGDNYYYTLDGIMKDWKENADGHLSFYNLAPGKYLLHVKGGDKYRDFAGSDTLEIVVKPHWWQTRWFSLLLLTVLGLTVAFLFRARIRAIRRQSGVRVRMAEAEMMALRAQMNPHFIFNSLNIVDGLISGKRNDEAKSFLQKFSKLMRLTLENSRQQLVSLESDLKTLKLYTELEWIRYSQSFNYSFDVDEQLLDESVRIPPMLLQPYVENAIIHGLRNRGDDQGYLFVSIHREGESLSIVIEDNGIGMERSAEINAGNNRIKKHLGMELTGRRMDLLRTVSSDRISVRVRDLSDPSNPARSGTRIELSLPLEYYFEKV